MELASPPVIENSKSKTPNAKRNIYGKVLNIVGHSSTMVNPQQVIKSITLSTDQQGTMESSITVTGSESKKGNVCKDRDKHCTDDRCIECNECYYTTKEKCDWIKCTVCEKWLHETCPVFACHCINCGRKNPRLKRK